MSEIEKIFEATEFLISRKLVAAGKTWDQLGGAWRRLLAEECLSEVRGIKPGFGAPTLDLFKGK